MNEYQYDTNVISSNNTICKLDMSNAEDVKLLLDTYKKSNPFSALPLIGNIGLIMFYCSGLMADNIYYVKDSNAVVIVDYKDDIMICHDIFCDEEDINIILSAVAQPDTKKVIFGFSPKLTDDYSVSLLKEEDTTLFVLADKENIFMKNKVMFLLLAHA